LCSLDDKTVDFWKTFFLHYSVSKSFKMSVALILGRKDVRYFPETKELAWFLFLNLNFIISMDWTTT
jgi:hypothetical protein